MCPKYERQEYGGVIVPEKIGTILLKLAVKQMEFIVMRKETIMVLKRGDLRKLISPIYGGPS